MTRLTCFAVILISIALTACTSSRSYSTRSAADPEINVYTTDKFFVTGASLESLQMLPTLAYALESRGLRHVVVDRKRIGTPSEGYDYLVTLNVSRTESTNTTLENEYGVVSREWKGGGELKCKTTDYGIIEKTRCKGDPPVLEETHGVVGQREVTRTSLERSISFYIRDLRTGKNVYSVTSTSAENDYACTDYQIYKLLIEQSVAYAKLTRSGSLHTGNYVVQIPEGYSCFIPSNPAPVSSGSSRESERTKNQETQSESRDTERSPDLNKWDNLVDPQFRGIRT